MRIPRPSPLGIVVVVLLAFLYLPLVVVVLYAFNGGSSLSWPLDGLSLRWFREVFGSDEFVRSIVISAKVAVAAAVVAAVVGGCAALAFTRRPTRTMAAAESISRLPAMLPGIFVGVALFTTMNVVALDPSIWTIIAGHVVVAVPLTIAVMVAALQNYDLDIEEAARDLGARPLLVLRRITLPILLPAVLGAMVLTVAISTNEVLITNFTSGTDATLPLLLVAKLRRAVDPTINAIATLLLLVPWVAFVLAWLLRRRTRLGGVR